LQAAYFAADMPAGKLAEFKYFIILFFAAALSAGNFKKILFFITLLLSGGFN
jgi:hypothetical protein